jgi:mono/diheme cytochrome c family protein
MTVLRILSPFVVASALAGPLAAQEAADFFRQNCVSCHTIGGGRLTGPDLKNVTARKDRAWLLEFVLNPQGALDRGDAYALKLQEDARGVVMPRVAGLDGKIAASLLDLIVAESKLPKSQFAGIEISDRPFTADEIAWGKALFTGNARLTGGGPSCNGCHTVRDLSALGGGRLGPDLTQVYGRLQGRKALATWLMAPATPTMQSVFRKQALNAREIITLTAYFEASAKAGGQDDSAARLNFFLLGLGGATVALIVFGSAWKGRFRAVRRPLVGKNGSQ